MNTDPIRVLLVDDDEDEYILTRQLLSEIDERRFEVKLVKSYDDASEAIRQGDHDVFLIDYHLGGCNGVDLIREAVQNGCLLPMILLTGHGNREVDMEAKEAGAADYLVKNQLDGTVLERSIRYAIENKRAENALLKQEKYQRVASEIGKLCLSTCDLQEVFNHSVQWIADTLDVELSKILLLNDSEDSLLLAAGVGWKEGLAGQAIVSSDSGSQAGYTFKVNRPVIVDDLQKETRFKGPPLLLDHHVISGMSTPMISQDKIIGVVGVHSRKHHTFTPDDAEFLQSVSNLIAVMIDHRRAKDTLRIKGDQLATVTQALTTFLERGNYQEASTLILRSALQQTASEYGFAGVVVEGPVLRILAHEGIIWDSAINREFYESAVRTYHEVGYLEFTNFENLFGKAITSHQAVLSNEAASDPRSGGRLPPGHPALRHFLGVPILRETEVVGIIGVANRPGGYTGKEQEKIEVLSQAAGVLYDSYRRELRETQLDEKRKQAEAEVARKVRELADSNTELERFNRHAVGRELRMIELKQQVNELSEALGRAAPYDLSFVKRSGSENPEKYSEKIGKQEIEVKDQSLGFDDGQRLGESKTS
jgi:GAF domain-containing protein/AmiR/NasT family two-component response regulator